MTKRILSALLAAVLILSAFPRPPAQAAWTAPETEEIANDYVRVTVSRENGGYVIATVEGDILKKSDNDIDLTHRGTNMDTSFTSLRIDGEDYIFGNSYGFLGLGSQEVVTRVDPAGAWISSVWSIKDVSVEQRISLVDSVVSEQLGTAMITYTVTNNGAAAAIESRVLIDTQLGDKDYGYYEIPAQQLGQGYEYFEKEQTWDSRENPGIIMPADYFVRDNPYAAGIVGYGVNSVFTDQKPYKMTFAHWANIASTRFDYVPDRTLNFTNSINGERTADSAVALYYDLGALGRGEAKSFTTYYGVTANLKNQNNVILINTTAPSALEFTDSTMTAYRGSEGIDNLVRINTTLTNASAKTYSSLAVVVYAIGFKAQRQTDGGDWIVYDNTDPVFTQILDFAPGQNRPTYFDFMFTPGENAQLGSFVTKVFDLSKEVNALGSYAEEFCLGTTENFIVLPGTNPALPAITLTGSSPQILFNDGVRHLTVTGRGMNFFNSDLLNAVELRGDNGKSYPVDTGKLSVSQEETPKLTLQLSEPMEAGRYQLYFHWKSNTGESALQGVPNEFTSSALTVQMSGDVKYRNDKYGVITVQRDENLKYKVVPYADESAFAAAGLDADKLLLTFRGVIAREVGSLSLYRLVNDNGDVTINHALNYHGSSLTIQQLDDGSVAVLMDGLITTVGANTTVRNGTAAFRLNAGTNYIVPVYNQRGEITKNGSLSGNKDFIELKWNNAMDTLLTIGGFLVDLQFGVLGKIEEGDALYDIISFGGGLDLGFLTPGGAAAVRQNTAEGGKWTVDEDDKDVAPKNKGASRASLGVDVHNVLYGGKNPKYLGFNAEANATLPKLFDFLPSKIKGNLHINTIGGYEVGVDAEVKMSTVEFAFSLVVKSNPSGAPIPDKAYFAIGGFEPGFNIDGVGVIWITGGGGGFDKLYETIYGKDGVPPLTLMLHVELDVIKVLTGSADLELSLHGVSIGLSDISLKMIENARFLDSGLVAIGWYPNFSVNLMARVNFLQIMSGSMSLNAAFGGDVGAFFQLVLKVGLGLPKTIPIVGGMQIASAELGGGSEKVWGSVALLEIIKVGFTYYWGAGVEFTHGSAGGTENFSALSADAGAARSRALFDDLTAPRELGVDPVSGEIQYVAVGSNLSFVTGSQVVSDFDARVAAAGVSAQMRGRSLESTRISTNEGRTGHLVTFGEAGDYILTVSRENVQLTAEYLQKNMKVTQGGKAYPLTYYTSPGSDADDAQKEAALKNANVNVANGVGYLIIPSASLEKGRSFLLEFTDGNAYDVGAIYVQPLSRLKTHTAAVGGQGLMVEWTGEEISDTAQLIVCLSDTEGQDGVVLGDPVKAKYSGEKGTATLEIPEALSSGSYAVTVILSDEGKAYDRYSAGSVLITNALAPREPSRVSLDNAGNDMLRVGVTPPEDKTGLSGYFVDVYADGQLSSAGLYFDKDADILIGGRYEMPVLNEAGQPVDSQGNPVGDDPTRVPATVTVGFTPGEEYSVRVRSVHVDDPSPDVDGDEIFHCSAYVTSAGETLRASTPPDITLTYRAQDGELVIDSDVSITGELYVNGGSPYILDTLKKPHTLTLGLPDGEHTLELHARNGEGDSVILTEIVSVDTTPPVILLESPVSGQLFTGSSLTVRAAAEPDAAYTFKLNGEAVSPREKDLFADGMLKCTLPMGEAASDATVILEVIATDAAGNETTKLIELSNGRLSQVSGITLYYNDAPVAEAPAVMRSIGDTADIQVMGILPGGEVIDITGHGATTLSVRGGSAADLKDGRITARNQGQLLLSATFDLGGGRSLVNGLVVKVLDTAAEAADIAAALALVESAAYTAAQSQASTAAQAKARVEQILAGLPLNGVTATVNGGSFTAASPGTASDPGGVNGSYTFTVTLSKGMADSRTTVTLTLFITAAPYEGGGTAPADRVYYTVTFRSNGGSAVSSQRVPQNGRAARPADPVRRGYVFTGWFADEALSKGYDFAAPVTQSLTLWAGWEPEGATPGQPWVNPFTDVSRSDWFYEDVAYVCTQGLFQGTAADRFSPGLKMTRGMLVTVLYRLSGSPDVSGLENRFDDVGREMYYADPVKWAEENGIVNGVGNASFAPEEGVTREQAATILLRYARYAGMAEGDYAETALTFADSDTIADWAVEGAKYCAAQGIITGKPGNLFDPRGSATRAEIAAILRRFAENPV